MRIINKCIYCALIVMITISLFGGIYIGYKSGVQAVCGDVAFYYNNDLQIKACITNNDIRKKDVDHAPDDK